MLYRYYEKEKFPHIIHLSEEDMNKISYDYYDDLRKIKRKCKEWFNANNLNPSEYNIELFDWQICFKNRKDALLFKMCWYDETI
jgi:hypothetical protein